MHACIIQPITFTCTSFDVLTYIMYNMHRSFVSCVVSFQPHRCEKIKKYVKTTTEVFFTPPLF